MESNFKLWVKLSWLSQSMQILRDGVKISARRFAEALRIFESDT